MIASFTVNHKNGQRYSAENLQILRKGWGSDYQKQVVVFGCSGVLTIFDIEDVKEIVYNLSETVLSSPV